jgi:hypothetical protein
MNRRDANDVLNSAGRWALMVGAVSFAIFWGMSLVAIDGPWALTLGLHGLSIVSIAFGLIRQYQSTPEIRNPLLDWIGVALTIIGTFASFLILALGLTILAISLWTNDQRRLAPVVLVGGSTALALAYGLGARIGTEDAADPSLLAEILFGIGVLLISLGLLIVGATTPRT